MKELTLTKSERARLLGTLDTEWVRNEFAYLEYCTDGYLSSYKDADGGQWDHDGEPISEHHAILLYAGFAQLRCECDRITIGGVIEAVEAAIRREERRLTNPPKHEG